MSSLNFHHPFLVFFVAVDALEAPFGCEHGGGRCDDKQVCLQMGNLPPKCGNVQPIEYGDKIIYIKLD